jgi:hypothetical protein
MMALATEERLAEGQLGSLKFMLHEIKSMRV